jgi:hypothetical protein
MLLLFYCIVCSGRKRAEDLSLASRVFELEAAFSEKDVRILSVKQKQQKTLLLVLRKGLEERGHT